MWAGGFCQSSWREAGLRGTFLTFVTFLSFLCWARPFDRRGPGSLRRWPAAKEPARRRAARVRSSVRQQTTLQGPAASTEPKQAAPDSARPFPASYRRRGASPSARCSQLSVECERVVGDGRDSPAADWPTRRLAAAAVRCGLRRRDACIFAASASESLSGCLAVWRGKGLEGARSGEA